VVGLGVAVVIALWAFYRLPQLGMLRAAGVSLLAIVLSGPSVQPWYLVWGIAILAAAYGARSASGIVLLTTVASFLGLVGLNLLVTEIGSLGTSLELLLLAALAASAIAPIATYPMQRKSHAPWDGRIFRQLRIQR
jgi:alpha-1,6-mannosyltransferase